MTQLVRRVTDAEVGFFLEHGWVHLPALVDVTTVGELARRSRERLTNKSDAAGNSFVDGAFGQDRDIADADDEFRRLAHDPVLGDDVARLLGSVDQIRLQITNLLVKHPSGHGQHSSPTVFHQDFPWMPMDRSRMLTVWVALVHVSPEMGPLRFYDESHRRGLLGRSFVKTGDDLPSQHPWLSELDIVGGFDMQPGDATVHHGLTVHGAAEDSSATDRLSFTATYFDAETLYTGAPYKQTDELGLQINEPFDHQRFPVISRVSV